MRTQDNISGEMKNAPEEFGHFGTSPSPVVVGQCCEDI